MIPSFSRRNPGAEPPRPGSLGRVSSMWPKRFLPVALFLAATLLGWGWQYLEYRSFEKSEKEAALRQGDLVLAAAEGMLHQQCLMAIGSKEELKASLEAVRAKVGASFLAVVHPDGKPFLAAGKPAPPGAEGVLRCERSFRFPSECRGCAPSKAGGRRGHPGGACRKSAFPRGEMMICLEYPADDLLRRLARRKALFFAVGGALTLAFGSLLLFYLGLLRSARLGARLAASAEHVRSLEFLRRLGAGLAHETKNPLGSVRGFAQILLKRDLPPEERVDAASRIMEETDRIVARLEEFLLLSRPADLRRKRVPLRKTLEDLAGLVRLELSSKEGTLEVTGPEVEIQADPDQLRRLFMNLLVNAAEALERGGRIRVEIRRDREGLRVVVEDDGPGVPEELRETMFEPYVSGKPSGTGLGLALARGIAREHGWALRYEPAPGGGTRMILEMEGGHEGR